MTSVGWIAHLSINTLRGRNPRLFYFSIGLPPPRHSCVCDNHSKLHNGGYLNPDYACVVSVVIGQRHPGVL